MWYILSLPIQSYMTNKLINYKQSYTWIQKDQFVDEWKNNDDLFDKSLLKETTEPIYDYIVEKIYQQLVHIEEEPFKNKRKLKK